MTRTTIHSDYIPDNAITGTKIAENSITAREIATNAITTLYVADNSVTEDKLADSINTSIAAKAPLASPALTGTVTAASHVQIAGNLDVIGQIGAYNNPGSAWGTMGLRATDYTFKNAGGTVKVAIDSSGRLFLGATSASALNTFSDDLIISNTASGTGAGISIVSNATNGYSNIHFGDTDDADIGRIQYNNTSNVMTFRTNTSDAITIDSSQNVGIANTSPSEKLSVHGGIQASSTGNFTSGNAGIYLDYNSSTGIGALRSAAWGSAFKTIEYMASTHVFKTGSGSVTERLRIDGSGGLFLNTTSAMDACFVTLRDHSNGEAFLGLEAKDDSNVGIRLGHAGTKKWVWYSDPSDNLIWYSNANSAERMRIHSNGNVGIGASSALDNKLEVNGGDIRVRGTSTPSIKFNNADQEVVGMRLQSGATGNLSFHTDKMVIDSSGNVGIGNSNPTQKLHIAGAKTYISNIVQGQLQVEDTTSAASGVGGGILFTGSYSGTTTTAAASIEAAKSNGSGGNYSFDMVFKTRDNGAGAVERARFGSDGGDPSYGRLRLTSSWGAMEIGAANSSYFHFQRSSGPAKYYFDNRCEASGGFHTYSDENLKKEITVIPSALNKVAQMNGVTFKWKDSAKRGGGDTGKQFGVTAQNMLAIDSELPTKNTDPLYNIEDGVSADDEYYTMDYNRITPFLIEAVKELKTKLEAAEARIATLEG